MNLWGKFTLRVGSKIAKMSVSPARKLYFAFRAICRKVRFFLQAQSCPSFSRTLPWRLLRHSAASISIFFGNLVGQSHCLSKVWVPAKEELLGVGFLPNLFTNSPRGCGQRFAISGVCMALVGWRLLDLEQMTYMKKDINKGTSNNEAWHMCGNAREHICEEMQENIQQRSMTYVWKCKRTSSNVAWRMLGSAREHPAT